MKKLSVLFIALLATVMVVSSASAINLNSRSQEMTANSSCDNAGSITLTFTEADYNSITAYLGGGAEYARLRVSLSGTDVALDADAPLLCKNIWGPIANTGVGLGAGGGNLPTIAANKGYVIIDEIDVEASDVTDGVGGGADGTPDVTSYVIGDSGSQYFTIYVTGIQPSSDWSDDSQLPWIKIGLYQELIDAGDAITTPICADVHDFSGLSKLTISMDLIPNSLTYTTSDNQIGHFLVESIEVRDCGKNDPTCAAAVTSSIQLCPLGTSGQSVSCDDYTYCMVAEGDYPATGDITFTVRTNGAAAGDSTQSGVYIKSVTFKDESNGAIVAGASSYYKADGTSAVADTDCTFEAQVGVFTIDAADIATGGNALVACITYQVNPDQAVADTDAMAWVNGTVIPCGTLFDTSRSMAGLFECGGVPSCMYFPYALVDSGSWATGVVITRLATEVAIADMEATFTLTDSAGNVFTSAKSDFDTAVFSFNVDSAVNDWTWTPATAGTTPAAGNCWIAVETNFTADGYSFVTNSAFGAGTLARLQTACGSFSLK